MTGKIFLQPVQPKETEPSTELRPMAVFRPEHPFLGYNKALYTRVDLPVPYLPGWKNEHTGEILWDVVAEKTVVTGYSQSEPGTLIPEADFCVTTAEFAFECVPPGMFWGYPMWIHLGALRALEREFGLSLPTEHVVRAYANSLARSYYALPISIRENTVLYRRAEVVKAQQVATAAGRLVKRTFPEPQDMARLLSAVVSSGVFSVNHTGLREEAYMQSLQRPAVERNNRASHFRITRLSGCNMVNGCPEYLTPDTRAAKRILVACQLRGDRDFVRFNRTANNQAASMVRVYKCRGGSRASDQLYSARQLAIFHQVLPFDCEQFNSIARLCVTDDHFLIGRARNPIRLPRVELPRESLVAFFQDVVDAYGVGEDPSWPTLESLWRKAYWDERPVVEWDPYDLVACVVYSSLFVFLLLYDVMTFRYYHGHFEHDKKALRKRVGEKFYGSLLPPAPAFVREITMEVKDEPAKVKYDEATGTYQPAPPRLYFSLGEDSSSWGGAHVALAKKHMVARRVVELGDWEVSFEFLDDNRPLDMGQLAEHVHSIYTGQERIIRCYFFSYDSFLVAPGHLLGADLSMCDQSMGPGPIHVVYRMMLSLGLPPDIVCGLVQQLTAPFRMRNPANKNEWFTGEFHSTYLVSGTTLTTIADNWGSLSALTVLASAIVDGRIHLDLAEDFAAFGIQVTVERFACMEECTILKRFFCRTTCGGWAAPLCIGARIRSFGKIDSQLGPNTVPGSTRDDPLEDRAKWFLGAVCESWKNEATDALTSAIRANFPHEREVKLPQTFRHKTKNDPRELDPYSICKRYGLEIWEWEHLVSAAATLNVGATVYHPSVTKVMAVDYGL